MLHITQRFSIKSDFGVFILASLHVLQQTRPHCDWATICLLRGFPVLLDLHGMVLVAEGLRECQLWREVIEGILGSYLLFASQFI